MTRAAIRGFGETIIAVFSIYLVSAYSLAMALALSGAALLYHGWRGDRDVKAVDQALAELMGAEGEPKLNRRSGPSSFDGART